MEAPLPARPPADDTAAHDHLRDLLDLANRDLSRQDAATLAARLRTLLQATMAHFTLEDRMMDACRYPGTVEHREAHTAYLIEFRRMNQELERHGISPMFRLWFTGRFQDWMRFHTRGSDAALARHWRLHLESQAAAGPAGPPAQPGAA